MWMPKIPWRGRWGGAVTYQTETLRHRETKTKTNEGGW